MLPVSQSDESDKSHVDGDGTLNPEARSDECKNEDVTVECMWQPTLQTGRLHGWKWGGRGVLAAIVLLYYSKRLTVPLLGCRDGEQPPGGHQESKKGRKGDPLLKLV